MHTQLPFFNWSLKKTLAVLPDSFSRARLKIIFTLLMFSLLKVGVVIFFSLEAAQTLQLTRGIIALIFYLLLLKFLLSFPGKLRNISHIMLIAGLLIVWSTILIFSHDINLPSLQFAFMIVLGSFYTLGSRAGIAYSIAAIVPVAFLVFFHNSSLTLTSIPEKLASPGFEIIITLNFLTIIISHYLFYKAFDLNIREKEKLNTQLQMAAFEAKKLAESRSIFLSTMSHELRTPLNSVVGVTELLLQDKPEERQKENLGILRYSALDLLSLVNNILDINKMDVEQLQLENTPFNLSQLIHSLCSGLNIRAKEKKLKLYVEVDERLKNVTVVSDPTRISQVIYNLAGNAIKFTEKGAVTVKLDLLTQHDHTADILFSVSDTGIGIHPERQKAVFELFTQAENDTTRKYGGTGLGLAIVKKVLSLFNSVIQLESQPSEGSRFFFTISFTTSENKVEEITPVIEQYPNLSHLKILVAEDNEVNQLVLQKQLHNLNISAMVVANGHAAYEHFMASDYDVLLLDLNMPGWDGYETTKRIRSHPDNKKSNVHLIAFTASVATQQHIIDSGFNDFLFKPVSMNDLREKLEKVGTIKKAGQL